MILRQLDLLFQTLRHVSPRHLFFRILYLVRKEFWRLVGKRAPSSGEYRLTDFEPLYLGVHDCTEPEAGTQDLAEALARAAAMARGRFRFLNVDVLYDEEINWHDPQVSRLWRFHLHYFDYVQDLLLWSAAGHDVLAWDTFSKLVKSWISGNGKVVGDGWHPFTLSVRIVNWLHAFRFWKHYFHDDQEFATRFVASLDGQVRILAASLEHDLGNNHLIKNLRALIWAGIAFGDRRWEKEMHRAIRLLRNEIAAQILGDGGHFERVPGYHAAILMDCIDIGLFMRRNLSGRVPDWLEGALQRMVDYLLLILPPDGNLPLLKDTARSMTPPPCDLLAAVSLYFNNPNFKVSKSFGLYPCLLFGEGGREIFRNWASGGEKAHPVSLPESGYVIMQDKPAGDYLIFDGGKVGSDGQSGHAHADMFSYELMIRGQRIVVDSGVYEYQAGGWRDYFRSTRAHNTLEIEGQNQCEVWGSFRVARRGRPFQVSCQIEDRYVLVQGKHDGYCRLQVPVVHRRIMLWGKTEGVWLVVDELMSREGYQQSEAGPRKTERMIRVDSHVHFHPKIEPERVDSSQWRLQGLDFPLWIRGFGQKGINVVRGRTEPHIQGWYSEDYGERVANSVLSFYGESTLPFLMGYAISREEHAKVICKLHHNGEREVLIDDDQRECRLWIGLDNVKFISSIGVKTLMGDDEL
jgi:uncharacterized heparinase superfamily protein